MTANWSTRWNFTDAPPFPLANILRAVSKCLVDGKYQVTGIVFMDPAIDAIAPTAREFDAEQPEMGAR